MKSIEEIKIAQYVAMFGPCWTVEQVAEWERSRELDEIRSDHAYETEGPGARSWQHAHDHHDHMVEAVDMALAAEQAINGPLNVDDWGPASPWPRERVISHGTAEESEEQSG